MRSNREEYPTPYRKKSKKKWEREQELRERKQFEEKRKTCIQCGEIRSEEEIEWNYCGNCNYKGA